MADPKKRARGGMSRPLLPPSMTPALPKQVRLPALERGEAEAAGAALHDICSPLAERELTAEQLRWIVWLRDFIDGALGEDS